MVSGKNFVFRLLEKTEEEVCSSNVLGGSMHDCSLASYHAVHTGYINYLL